MVVTLMEAGTELRHGVTCLLSKQERSHRPSANCTCAKNASQRSQDLVSCHMSGEGTVAQNGRWHTHRAANVSVSEASLTLVAAWRGLRPMQLPRSRYFHPQRHNTGLTNPGVHWKLQRPPHGPPASTVLLPQRTLTLKPEVWGRVRVWLFCCCDFGGLCCRELGFCHAWPTTRDHCCTTRGEALGSHPVGVS